MEYMECPDQQIKIDFSYTDEFGQESRVIKNFTDACLIDRDSLEFLVDEFKLFLIASGFNAEYVNSKIQLVEE